MKEIPCTPRVSDEGHCYLSIKEVGPGGVYISNDLRCSMCLGNLEIYTTDVIFDYNKEGELVGIELLLFDRFGNIFKRDEHKPGVCKSCNSWLDS